jgi:poly(hydroxyalkanoate) depolymerase family esterase
MKNALAIFSFFIIHLVNCQDLNPLKEIEDFGNNPGNLKMFVHGNLTNDTLKRPLVVVLHGCGETANSVSELTGWNKLADLNDFIVLYPQQKLFNNTNLCFNWFINHDIEKDQGESGSIYQMIIYAKEHFAIDSGRVFITGLSAGAAMSMVLVATHPEVFSGGAIFAGGAYKIATTPMEGMRVLLGKELSNRKDLVNDVKEQNPAFSGQYPPIIVYQGLNDPVVNYRNAAVIVNQWTGINNADLLPDQIEPFYQGNEDIKRSEYTDKDGRLIVTLYEVNNLGHRLMIKPGENKNEGGKTGVFGVNKNFHSTYHIAQEFGIILKD